MKKESLIVPLGKDTSGKAVACSLSKQGHLLIGGNTGTGKTTLLHSLISSALFSSLKTSVKLCLIDTNVIDFAIYKDIPQLLCPVITDHRQALKTLIELLDEMMNRLDLFSRSGIKSIEEYNCQFRNSADKMPYYLIVISELSDLMIMNKGTTEELIGRIAKLGKNAGLHLIICSDRSSTEIFSPLITADISARICFDSRYSSMSSILLGITEPVHLVKGEMLYWSKEKTDAIRVHGRLITEEEIKQMVDGFKGSVVEPDDKAARKARKASMLQAFENYFKARSMIYGVYSRGAVSSNILLDRSYNEDKIEFDYVVRVRPDGFLLKACPYIMLEVWEKSEEIQLEVALFLHAVNSWEYAAQFECDTLKSFFITMKTYVRCDAPPSEELIDRCFEDINMMLERYKPGIYAIVYNGASAAEAFKFCVPDRKDEGDLNEYLITDPEEIKECEQLFQEQREKELAEEDEDDPDVFTP